MSRELLIQIFGRLGQINYKLLMGTSIKGGTDSLFFIHDPEYRVSPSDFAILSLNKTDRLRLINCESLKEVIRGHVNASFGVQREENKYGSHEFKLNGNPWHASGHEAIASRRLIAQISRSMLAYGWDLRCALDLSRGLDDKSILIFSRVAPTKTPFACIAFSDIDKVRILGFPANVSSKLRDVIVENHLPGIEKEKEKEEDCLQIRFNESSWSSNSIHARGTLVHLMAAAASYGWDVVASADVSAKYIHQENGPDYPVDVHSWYLVYRGQGHQR